MDETAKQQAAKPKYANFNPGPIRRETPVPGVKLDFNYGVRLAVPQGN